MDQLLRAVKTMAAVFGDGMFADHVGSTFTCGEADAVAEVLIRAGHKDEAETWLSYHAMGDEDGDDIHHDFYDRESNTKNVDEINQYMRLVLGSN